MENRDKNKIETVRKALESSNGRIMRVDFIKKDGSDRKMMCRLGVKKFLKGGKRTYDFEAAGKILVADVDETKGKAKEKTRDKYKAITLLSVYGAKVNGVEMTFSV